MKQLPTTLLALTLLFSPLAYAHEEGATMQSSPDAEKAPYDIQFLDTMTQHHRDGIKMMEMAVDKAQSQQVKDKAQMMLDDQQKDIPKLKSLRDEVRSDAPEAINMKFPGMKPMDMSKLESLSGSAFDHVFLDTTIKHHQDAVEMSRAELKSGKSQMVKDKAQEIIDKQTKEIEELKQMRDSMKK